MKKAKTIVYVNFAPYENAGNILDFVLDNFQVVILFRFNFHKLTNNQEQSMLVVYKNRKIVKRQRLYQTPTTESLAFLLLPIRSFVIFVQLFILIGQLKKKYKNLDYYFTVNAFTAWAGNLLRLFKQVDKTIFWVWDYYPPLHENKIVMFMRWLYWQFDKPATIHSDQVIFLNQRLEDLRKEIGVINKNKEYPVVPIGTTPAQKLKKKQIKHVSLVFLGVVKKSQGLDLFFDEAQSLAKKHITLHVIGGGPDLEYFKRRSKECPIEVIFHGYVQNDENVNKIIESCHIGLATYLPEESNVSYYSDPSKIKRYLSYGLPVITTNVFNFSKEIKLNNAGFVINYEPNKLSACIEKITKNYSFFQKNAYNLSKKYYYKNIYKTLFENL